jgi:hypothetical protein
VFRGVVSGAVVQLCAVLCSAALLIVRAAAGLAASNDGAVPMMTRSFR